MCWPSLLRALFLSLALFAAAGEAGADDAVEEPGMEVWLVTYGPGETYWQRFGHNAIWVRDPARGLDHTFNFGFFDFAQDDFFLRFLMGRMLYFSAAQPSAVEFEQYVSENRGIRAQRLALSVEQSAALVQALLHGIRPENRDYLYDYYADNCSTRVRDALDRALEGALRQATEAAPARGNLRDHTRRLTQDDFWLYLGLQSVLGLRIDRQASRWQEMFIPAVLAEELASMEGLVLEDRVLFESTLDEPPDRPGTVWPRYLLASVGLILAAWLLSRWLPPAVLARGWFALSGVLGLAILFFWFGTDHRVAGQNLNLLIFNPLWLWLAFRGTGRSATMILVGFFSAAALILALLSVQYTADVAAAFVPISLAAAYALWKAGSERTR